MFKKTITLMVLSITISLYNTNNKVKAQEKVEAIKPASPGQLKRNDDLLGEAISNMKCRGEC